MIKMSYAPQIIPWAIENYPPSDYDSFQDWFDAVNQRFEEDERWPLTKFFEPDDMDLMGQAFDEFITPEEMEPETKQEAVQSFIEESRELLESKAKEKAQEKLLEEALSKPAVQESIKEAVKPSILKQIASFFSRIFRR